ncbi:hypothetical protein EBZ80_27195 [bacterium]|nr:hypothetical protein [bacterium]
MHTQIGIHLLFQNKLYYYTLNHLLHHYYFVVIIIQCQLILYHLQHLILKYYQQMTPMFLIQLYFHQ